MEEIGKLNKTYTTRSVEKNLMGDAIKENKSTNTKIRKLKKGITIEEENLKVVEFGKGEEKINVDVVEVT